MRPFYFTYRDVARWKIQHYDPVARRPWFEHMEQPRSRTILVIDVTLEWITYQVAMQGHPHNASPTRVKAETFREFFAAALEEQADNIRRQVNGA